MLIELIEEYENISIRQKIAKRFKRKIIPIIVLFFIGWFLIFKYEDSFNVLVRSGLMLLFLSIMCLLIFQNSISSVNEVIRENSDKCKLDKLPKLNIFTASREYRVIFHSIIVYEQMAIKRFLKKKKLYKKDKINVILSFCEKNKNGNNFITILQTVLAVPIALNIVSNYISMQSYFSELEFSNYFIISLAYTLVIVLILSALTLVIGYFKEIIDIPSREKDTYKELEGILRELYLQYKS